MSDWPSFTVVIPTYDRPRQLSACLEALARLDYPPDRLQVVVVDDASPEPLDAAVDPFRGRLDVTLVRQEHAGPATARNRGADLARGEFLAFTDDDCEPAPDWLRALAAGFAAAPGHLLGGKTINRLSENTYSAASQALIDYLYEYFDAKRGQFFASNNLAVARRAFLEVGGFDTSFPLAAAEDREFCDRWVRGGRETRFVPEARVDHAHPLDLVRFLRQHFNYGRGAYYFRLLLARDHSGRVRVEPPSFYSNLLRYPLATGTGGRAIGISLLFGASQFANAAGFFFERARMALRRPGRGPARA